MKSRKRKQKLREVIRWAKKGYSNTIHDIWDDYYYWIARQSWEELHKGLNYEDYYKNKIKNKEE